MVNVKAVTIVTLFVALIGVILSVTAAPTQRRVVLIKRAGNQDTNQTALESDSIPVSSNGNGSLTPYDDNNVIPQNVTDNGNSAKGDGTGL
ncbi:hypothetical protein RclHR1_01620018 [Rhizophagus clarus]|uniref:Uncharacterized protein n=1 Tax=Rhizophagus clarus TaxID=94130 RepID=A0A2Z6R9V6_9GLOM|nr:hypothetical protein RclHR1_01620018 [Rhizophagus clarus]GES92013.1 hypothetical protein GLOIN_2v1641246 [Rhizophagus clarus]